MAEVFGLERMTLRAVGGLLPAHFLPLFPGFWDFPCRLGNTTPGARTERLTVTNL